MKLRKGPLPALGGGHLCGGAGAAAEDLVAALGVGPEHQLPARLAAGVGGGVRPRRRDHEGGGGRPSGEEHGQHWAAAVSSRNVILKPSPFPSANRLQNVSICKKKINCPAPHRKPPPHPISSIHRYFRYLYCAAFLLELPTKVRLKLYFHCGLLTACLAGAARRGWRWRVRRPPSCDHRSG